MPAVGQARPVGLDALLSVNWTPGASPPMGQDELGTTVRLLDSPVKLPSRTDVGAAVAGTGLS